MPATTVTRRWTVVTWLVAGASDEVMAVRNALRSIGADAVALQSVRRDAARAIAEPLEHRHEWALSFYAQTPIMRSSGVGLCVLTPHEIPNVRSSVISARSSVWSRQRRIAQAAVVRRADHSEYRLLHRVGADPAGEPVDTGNVVIITPEQVGVDAARAIVLPEAARLVDARVERPIATVAPLQATTFEMDWVQGDFPV